MNVHNNRIVVSLYVLVAPLAHAQVPFVDSVARTAVARNAPSESESVIASGVLRAGIGGMFTIGTPAPRVPSPNLIRVEPAHRDSHVAAGIIVGAAAGAAVGVYLAHHDPGCRGRSVSDCQPTLYWLPYPIVFGVAGGALGGVVTWIWSKR